MKTDPIGVDVDKRAACSDPSGWKGPLFDSTRLVDHMQARKLCVECPIVERCTRLAVEISRDTGRHSGAHGPEGTWGGLLWIAGVPHTLQTAARDEATRRHRLARLANDRRRP